MAYFPNGTAGEFLDRQCDECPLADDAPCPILLVQLEYNYAQHDNPDLEKAMNLLIDEGGHCKMKPLIEQSTDPPGPLDTPITRRPMAAMREWAKARGLPVEP